MLMDFVWLQQQTFIDNNEAKLKKSVTEISHVLNLKLEFSCQKKLFKSKWNTSAGFPAWQVDF